SSRLVRILASPIAPRAFMEPQQEPEQVTLTTAAERGGNGAAPAAPPAAEERTTSSSALTYVIPKATDPHPVPDGAPLDHPTLYFNRELSWLDFNWRVLAQALDERTPLLERVRFLAIAANNL